MKRSIVAAACGLLLCLVTLASGRLDSSCRLTLRLIDSQTGQTVPGLIRIVDRAGKPVSVQAAADDQGAVRELLSRGLGLKDQPAIESWSVVTGEFTLTVPRQPLIVEAFSGLETELARQPLAGYSGTDAASIQHVDTLRWQPRWNRHANLLALKDQTVRLRFTLKNAHLFAFQIQPPDAK